MEPGMAIRTVLEGTHRHSKSQ